jgi:elongator complex protein 3
MHKAEKGVVPNLDNIKLKRIDYNASGGKEVFLSFEDKRNDILIGFLRLRIPGNPFREEFDDRTAIIRELHVYGPMVEIGEEAKEKWQHRGYGAELLAEAQRIAKKEFSEKKLLVISGIGARNYYRKYGFKRDGAYMAKKL